MKILILAGTVFGLGVGAAYAGDGGDFPMPPPAPSHVAPSAAPTTKSNAPVLNAFVAQHRTTTSLFPPNTVGGWT